MTNETIDLVAEYVEKQRLAKLGYSFNGDEVDSYTWDIYLLISSEFSKLEQRELKKRRK